MKKAVGGTLLLVLAASLGAAQMEVDVNPWDFMSGNGRIGAVIRLDSSQTITEELFVAGAVVEIESPVANNATLFGAHVRMLADVAGDFMAGGAVIEVTGNVSGKADIFGASVYLDGSFDDSLEAGGAVVFISGHIKGPVFVSAAEIYIEEGAIIEDTLRYSAATIHQSEGAVLASGTRQIIIEKEHRPRHEIEVKPPRRGFGRWITVTILSFLFFAGAGILLSLLFPKHFKNVTGRLMVNPGLSALTGGVAFLSIPLAFFLIILLFASIVGIGAGLFFSVIYLIGIIFSIVYAGTALGRWLLTLGQKGKKGKKTEPHIILSMLLGTFIAVVLCRIPFAGWLFRIGAFIFGFGAFLITLWLSIKPKSSGSRKA